MKPTHKGLLSAVIAAVFASFVPQGVLANPELVADITPGIESSSFEEMAVVNNHLEFAVGNEKFLIDAQGQLTRTDRPNSLPAAAVEFNGEFYFTNFDGVYQFAADAEPTLLYSFPEPPVGSPFYFYEAFDLFVENNALLLIQREDQDGDEAYSLVKINIDGTAAEELINPYYPWGQESDSIPNFSYYDYLAPHMESGQKKYYLLSSIEAGEELWVVEGEGTNTSLTLVADINPGDASSWIGAFEEFNGEFYFIASGDYGRELYKLDASDSVSLVADIAPDGDAFIHGFESFFEFKGELYFVAFHDHYGHELWKTDGTEFGTVLVKDAVPGPDSLTELGWVGWQHVAGDVLFFIVSDDGTAPFELWGTNGTDDGTQQVLSDTFKEVKESFQVGSNHYLHLAGYVGGNAPDIKTTSLVKITDGNIANAEIILDDVEHNVVCTESALALCVVDYDSALWVLSEDGQLEHFAAASDMYLLAAVNDKVLFSAKDPVHGQEIWVTDGSAVGTYLLKDIYEGADSSNHRNGAGHNFFAELPGKVIFYANDGVTGEDLWVSDGTAAGTGLLKDFVEIPAFHFFLGDDYIPTNIDNNLYFIANDGSKEELWVTDGSTQGTVLVGPTMDFNNPILPQEDLIGFNGDIYYQVYTSTYGTELWKYTPASSTTVAGTGTLGDFVWIDQNGDGIQSIGEFGLEGVSVELQTCSGNFVTSAITDSMGFFQFSNVAVGHFQMQYFLPSGYRFSPVKAGSSIHHDSNASVSTGTTPCYDMTQGNQRLAADAGMIPVTVPGGDGLLGDYIWQDINGDGIQDASEPGLANVTVNLQRCDGTAVSSTISDSDGNFRFDSLARGDYRLEFELLNGYSFSPEKSANNYQLDSNANSSTGLTVCYDMNAGQQRRGVDAGLVPNSTGTADTVSVVKAIYLSATKRLWVRAESSASPQGSAEITASIEVNGTATELGQVGWKVDKGFYQTNFRDLAEAPSTVTLKSALGGEVTASVRVQ